ncbi:histidine phosphotransferase family protein [Caulobacter segnis]|uniref:histidine phosphotransferase ChpT n=1 Tax=Caulobacter segnis TaxID=88688 RepID=UPI00240ECDBF|nr:histidine phosphotransferase family protein [Caulobacter segnis]MDG2521633.1 histidine phosphotransferase family protein [Caulobacter segnis]
MTDAADTPAQQSPSELAALLAARLCHDFISPASAIVSGLDLLEDPTAQDMREDAMSLINASARKLVDLLQFSRVAFGASAAAESFDCRDLETLAQGVYAHVRPELEWVADAPQVNKPAARALLNLAQIAAGALPTGGKARLRVLLADNRYVITVDASGPRARLRPEVVAGLKGEPLGDGIGGQWIQAAYLHNLVKASGGQVAAETAEERVTLAAWVPA